MSTSCWNRASHHCHHSFQRLSATEWKKYIGYQGSNCIPQHNCLLGPVKPCIIVFRHGHIHKEVYVRTVYIGRERETRKYLNSHNMNHATFAWTWAPDNGPGLSQKPLHPTMPHALPTSWLAHKARASVCTKLKIHLALYLPLLLSLIHIYRNTHLHGATPHACLRLSLFVQLRRNQSRIYNGLPPCQGGPCTLHGPPGVTFHHGQWSMFLNHVRLMGLCNERLILHIPTIPSPPPPRARSGHFP